MTCGYVGLTGTAGTVATLGVGAGGGAASAGLSNRSTTSRLPYCALGAGMLLMRRRIAHRGSRLRHLLLLNRRMGNGNAVLHHRLVRRINLNTGLHRCLRAQKRTLIKRNEWHDGNG